MLLGAIALGTMFGIRRTRGRKAQERWATESPMDDETFLRACGIPNDPFRRRVAVKARTAIANLAGVPPATILPDHTFAHDLVELPYWDSLDWLGYVFEVERLFHNAIAIPSPVEAAFHAAGLKQPLCVKHLVKATSLAATRRHYGRKRPRRLRNRRP